MAAKIDVGTSVRRHHSSLSAPIRRIEMTGICTSIDSSCMRVPTLYIVANNLHFNFVHSFGAVHARPKAGLPKLEVNFSQVGRGTSSQNGSRLALQLMTTVLAHSECFPTRAGSFRTTS